MIKSIFLLSAILTSLVFSEVDFTDSKLVLLPNSWSKGNGTVDANTGNAPTLGGLYQNCVRTNMASGYGYVYNSGDGYERFDGTDDRILTDRTVNFTNASKNSFTMRIENKPLGTDNMVYSYYLNSSNYWYIYITSSNTVWFTIRSGDVSSEAKTSTTIGVNSTITAVKDGLTMKVYIDGIEASYSTQDTYTTGNTAYVQATVGYWLGSGSPLPFGGNLLYLIEWERAITDSEVLEYHNLGNDLGLVVNNVGDALSIASTGNKGTQYKNRSYKSFYKNSNYKGVYK